MKINNYIKESYVSNEIMNLLLKFGFNVKCDTPIPTHFIAIEWIRVNFDIWVKIAKNNRGEYFWNFGSYQTREYKTPQEATDAALLYTLKNLITIH